jgi:hypothetical protein
MDPFIAAGGRVSFPAGLRADPEFRKDIIPTTEQLAKQKDFSLRSRGRFTDEWRCGSGWNLGTGLRGNEFFVECYQSCPTLCLSVRKLGEQRFLVDDCLAK